MADTLPPTPTPEDDAAAARWKSLQLMQPFGRDICESWHESEQEGHVPLNERTIEQLRALRAGERVLLIRAPRAGFGKTHLIGQAASLLKQKFTPMTLPWQSADGMTWTATGRGLLADISRGDEPHDTLWQLCAGVCATLLRRLIQTGRIPSADPTQALQVLEQPPQEIFGTGSTGQVIGAWFREHFAQLCGPMAESSNLDNPAEAEAWIRAMFEHMERPSTTTLADLFALIARDSEAQTPRFLRLAASWKPLVLLADHMDAFYRDPESGVALARMALTLASLPGVHVVMSVNQDLWETTFGPQLPSALEDRLNARSVSLNGMNATDADALVKLRLNDAGVTEEERTKFLGFLDLERFFLGRPLNSVSPRALLRHAAAQWRIFAEHGASIPEAPPPAPLAAAVFAPAVELPTTLPAVPPPAEEDLTKLAQSLARDAEGEQFDLSTEAAPESESLMLSAIPPESFLPGDDPNQPDGAPTAFNESSHTSFQKLRQMLARVRVSSEEIASSPAAEAGPPAPLAPAPATVPTVSQPAPEASPQDLQQRYEELRTQFGQNGKSRHMDTSAVGDLVGIAGRRFPVVRYDEVDLPDLPGRPLPRWSLQGSEILFGTGDFADHAYWQTVCMFLAGRLAATQAGVPLGEPAPRLKLAVFKNDENAPNLAALFEQNVIPESVQPLVDPVHLDTRSLASIHAMREVVREADSGSLHADSGSVLHLMAQELDFLWKRVTRQD